MNALSVTGTLVENPTTFQFKSGDGEYYAFKINVSQFCWHGDGKITVLFNYPLNCKYYKKNDLKAGDKIAAVGTLSERIYNEKKFCDFIINVLETKGTGHRDEPKTKTAYEPPPDDNDDLPW